MPPKAAVETPAQLVTVVTTQGLTFTTPVLDEMGEPVMEKITFNRREVLSPVVTRHEHGFAGADYGPHAPIVVQPGQVRRRERLDVPRFRRVAMGQADAPYRPAVEGIGEAVIRHAADEPFREQSQRGVGFQRRREVVMGPDRGDPPVLDDRHAVAPRDRRHALADDEGRPPPGRGPLS